MVHRSGTELLSELPSKFNRHRTDYQDYADELIAPTSFGTLATWTRTWEDKTVTTLKAEGQKEAEVK